jgi:hypothetical protein
MAIQVTMTVTRPDADTVEMGTSAEFDSAIDTAKSSGSVLRTSKDINGLVTTYTAVFVDEEAKLSFDALPAVVAYHIELNAYNTEHNITKEFSHSEI